MRPIVHILKTLVTISYGRLWPLAFCLLLLLACSQEAPQFVPSSQEQINRGERLYNTHCLTCHGGATGRSMMAIPPAHNANGHTWHHPDCQLVDTVLNGSGEMSEMMREMMGVPESAPRMPAFRDTLTREEIQAILAYIKTWWTEEQRQSQRRATEQSC